MLEHLCEHLCGKPLFWTLLLEVVEGELELRDRLLNLLVVVDTQHARENGSDNEVQRTMLQIVTELDGFDARGNIK